MHANPLGPSRAVSQELPSPDRAALPAWCDSVPPAQAGPSRKSAFSELWRKLLDQTLPPATEVRRRIVGGTHPAWAWLLLLGLAGCASPGPRPAVVQHHPRPYDAPYQQPNELNLRLLTFNVWGLPAWLAKGSPGRFDRIAAELERAAPDLVLLQEVWTARAGQALPVAGQWSVATGTQSPWICRRSGLVTLSQHPIVSGEFRPFRYARWPDVLVTKGALKTTLELAGGQRVTIWNVHLQAGRTAHARRVRARQITQLLEWVRETEDGQTLDIIAGDFNCTPDSQEHRVLTHHWGPDAQAVLRQSHAPTYHAPKPRPRPAKTIDYVFFVPRGGFEFRAGVSEVLFAADQREERLSDHFALQVSLGFELADSVVAASGVESFAVAPFNPLLLGRLLAPAQPED
jgi:endonuclease/exonuclease/phosphatase family metal-dependent hydrolase